MSVLTDYVGVAENGKKFEYVWSEEAAKGRPEAVYFEKDPQAGAPRIIFHDKQEEYIKGKLKQGLDQRLDQKTTDTFTPEKVYGYNNPNKPETTEQRKNRMAREQGRRATARIKDFIIGDRSLKMEDLQYFRNITKGKVHGLGIRYGGEEDGIGFYIEKEKGVYTPIVRNINNTSHNEIAQQILASGHFNFFEPGLQGRYSIVNNLSKSITKDLELQQFTVDEETGEGAYIEVDVDEEITDQGAKEGVKMTSAQGYTSSLNKKGSGIKKGSSSSVGNLLKSSYFTGSGDNVFNSESVKMSNLSKKQVAEKFKDMDDTTLPSWITAPASKYEAIYIEPKDKSFPGILLPVDAKYDEDF